MHEIYIDGDACPVKDETYRVAQRYDWKVYVVAAGRLRVPERLRVEMIRVKPDFGAADDWIAEHVGEGDVAITNDIPLAQRCLAKGAAVIGPTGRVFTEESIGEAVAVRDLMDHLRQMGETTKGPPPFTAADRSRFLSKLDEVIGAIRRRSGS